MEVDFLRFRSHGGADPDEDAGEADHEGHCDAVRHEVAECLDVERGQDDGKAVANAVDAGSDARGEALAQICADGCEDAQAGDLDQYRYKPGQDDVVFAHGHGSDVQQRRDDDDQDRVVPVAAASTDGLVEVTGIRVEPAPSGRCRQEQWLLSVNMYPAYTLRVSA
ncbi:hypothetical protein [Arthrobacter sp.]|uniref:hypothetical protein n=1 Tax=Arthrobacter sp. TaxID=1667 RepID=UPI003A93A398